MSKLFVDFTIAFRNLVQHTRRTLFLGSAIATVNRQKILGNLLCVFEVLAYERLLSLVWLGALTTPLAAAPEMMRIPSPLLFSCAESAGPGPIRRNSAS